MDFMRELEVILVVEPNLVRKAFVKEVHYYLSSHPHLEEHFRGRFHRI